MHHLNLVAYLGVSKVKQPLADFSIIHELVNFQENGRYADIIAFGEIRGTNRWYDLGHFHMRDTENTSYSHWLDVIHGYSDVALLPSNYECCIRFMSILINVRALVRSLQKRPTNRYTRHQLKVLREDMAVLLI